LSFFDLVNLFSTTFQKNLFLISIFSVVVSICYSVFKEQLLDFRQAESLSTLFEVSFTGSLKTDQEYCFHTLCSNVFVHLSP
jgi:hypothetical protein